MIVLCTGPESSGTRLLTRMVSELDVEAVHKSIPNGDKWWDSPLVFDAAIFISRDPWMTELSGIDAKHIDTCGWEGKDREYPYRLTNAWKIFFIEVVIPNKKWIPINYESLVSSPQWTMDNIADWLGVERKIVTEKMTIKRKVPICNTALGLLREEEETINNLLEYMRNHG